VELHQHVGWDLRRRSVQGPQGGMTGTAVSVVGQRVCAAPCDLIVDGQGGQTFFFAGEGISESEPFSLAGESGELFYKVKQGSSSAHRASFPLMGLGGAGVLVGAVVMGIGAGRRGDTLKHGGVVFGVSSALVGLGIGLLFAGRTTFTVSHQDPSPPASATAPR